MSLRILCLHGIATDESGPWIDEWQDAVKNGCLSVGTDVSQLEFHKWDYNPQFKAIDANLLMYAKAVKDLLKSLHAHRSAKGLGDLIDNSIGMVAKWVACEPLRAALRTALAQHINALNPHLICAHSMGSLIAYDTLASTPELGKNRLLVTLGSQIGHPALRETFGAYLKPITPLRHWFHLYNPNDSIFTAELPLDAENLSKLTIDVDLPGIKEHGAGQYLNHPVTSEFVWSGLPKALAVEPKAVVAGKVKPVRQLTTVSASTNEIQNGNWFSSVKTLASTQVLKPHKRRALLIGINDYPLPENCLSGCVNDVFEMSALLQERQYAPEEIRVVLNDRATTVGILDRLHWLLDGVRAGDERLLFFSGHGAQIASYGPDGEPDHKDEVLVTHDFNWQTNMGISDDSLAALYANLPYTAKLTIILDCCHSGGMTRSGGATVRGINPPDDVRHREIAWSNQEQMWFLRKNMDLSDRLSKQHQKSGETWLGSGVSTQKIGRAVGFWSATSAEFDEKKIRFDHKGAYNPVVLAACAEHQFAYEYTHGAVSYGAMTFMLAYQLRNSPDKPLQEVVDCCNRVLSTKLKLAQTARLYQPGREAPASFPGVKTRKKPVSKNKSPGSGAGAQRVSKIVSQKPADDHKPSTKKRQ